MRLSSTLYRYYLNSHFFLKFYKHFSYRCALALSITNMLVRAAISRKLGINELPKVLSALTYYIILVFDVNLHFSPLHSLALLILVIVMLIHKPYNHKFLCWTNSLDTVLRKEVNIPCDQPDGTHIPFGEALTIEEIFQKTGGMLSRVRKNGSDMKQITAYC